jgi:DNA-binding PadR family transcriptional regulator
VNELAQPYDVSVQAVSKHLKVLEDAGLVSRSREAQRRPVHLEAEVFDLMTKWIERYRRQAEERYRRLDDVLRSMPDDDSPPAPRTGTVARTHDDTVPPAHNDTVPPAHNDTVPPAHREGAPS